MNRVVALAAVLTAFAATASASPNKPRLLTHLVKHLPRAVPASISHTLYLNQCTGGCQLKVGNTDATTNTSDIPSSDTTLSAFSFSATTWNDTVSCVKSTMSAFNIQVVTTKPTSGSFFEVMIADASGELGLPSDVGGIADYLCGSPGNCEAAYFPNALVFDFANTIGDDSNELCAVAAQEIAHAWNLDHVVDDTDPMTYNPYSGVRKYHNGEKCGSDCQNNGSGCLGPFGSSEACTGTCNGQATHLCMGTGSATQDEITSITALFGPSDATPPTVSFTTPTNGASVEPGFSVTVACTSSDGVQSVELDLDGTAIATLTSSPYKFQTATSVTNGAHVLTATCTSEIQATATATADINVGQKCTTDANCPTNYICYQAVCIAGPSATNGLGAPCTSDGQCASNSCSSDGTMSLCTVPCSLSNDECPSGFGCLPAGSSGECWAGAANGGSGGCDSGRSTPSAPWLLLLGVVGLWISRRPRNARR